MQKIVTNGDLCTCGSGNIPCPIKVLDSGRKMISQGSRVVIATDSTTAHISTFGMCNNMANPAVQAATAAAHGVLTPAPCVPVFTGKWDNAVKKTKMDGIEVVGEKSTMKCAYGGCIKIINVSNQKSKSE